MIIETWKIVAMLPPLMVWLGLYLYIRKIEKKVQQLEQTTASMSLGNDL
jgi:hypothetical protein